MVINKYLTKVNYNSLKGKVNKYIVIHYTANNGDTAKGNCKYFYSTDRGSSAHYFVDENGVWQCVEDKNVAWHCGAQSYKHPYCRNNNSIGIELCSRKDGNYYFKDKTVDNAVELVKMLMAKYNVPVENVIRHYDVTGKICPEPFVRDITKWQNFKERLVEDMTEAEVISIAAKVANDMVYKYRDEVYNTIDEVPEWGKATVNKLISKGILEGDEKGLNLSYTLLRMLVMNDRAGVYN